MIFNDILPLLHSGVFIITHSYAANGLTVRCLLPVDCRKCPIGFKERDCRDIRINCNSNLLELKSDYPELFL